MEGQPFAKQRRRARRGATRGYNEAMGVRMYLFRADRIVLEDVERACDVLGFRSVGTLLNAFMVHWLSDIKKDPEAQRLLEQRQLHVRNVQQTLARPRGYGPIGRNEVLQAQAEWEAKREPGPPVVRMTRGYESEEEEARRLSREGTEETPL